MDKNFHRGSDYKFIPMTSIFNKVGFQIASDVYYYTDQMVNIVFLGDPMVGDWVLVDAGLPYAAPEIKKVVEERFGGRHPKAIILTHGHFDHVGGLIDLMEEWDVYVYALDANRYLKEPQKGPFDTGRTQVIRPKLNNPRIIAQHGWFSAHKYSKSSKKFVPLEKNNEISESVQEIKIPEDTREKLLKSLDRHGVSSRTLFPDLEGLCKYINWKNETN